MDDDNDNDDEPSISLPRYAIMQHRGEACRALALVQSRAVAKKLVLREAKRYSGDDEYFVVLDGACGDGVKVVGACCSKRYDLVITDEDEPPKLMPVEIARLFAGEDGVHFLTDNWQLKENQ